MKVIAVDYIEDGDTWQVEFDGMSHDIIVKGSDADTEQDAIKLAMETTKEEKQMTTEVMFRKWKNDGDVMALFPYEIENHNGDVMSYMHIGQHGSANYNHCIDSTTPATPDEYKDLLKELEIVGYNLKIVKRRNYIKLTAIKRLTEDK